MCNEKSGSAALIVAAQLYCETSERWLPYYLRCWAGEYSWWNFIIHNFFNWNYRDALCQVKEQQVGLVSVKEKKQFELNTSLEWKFGIFAWQVAML